MCFFCCSRNKKRINNKSLFREERGKKRLRVQFYNKIFGEIKSISKKEDEKSKQKHKFPRVKTTKVFEIRDRRTLESPVILWMDLKDGGIKNSQLILQVRQMLWLFTTLFFFLMYKWILSVQLKITMKVRGQKFLPPFPNTSFTIGSRGLDTKFIYWTIVRNRTTSRKNISLKLYESVSFRSRLSKLVCTCQQSRRAFGEYTRIYE